MPRIDRQAIYERDRGLCGICGEPVPIGDVDLDHVIHRWRGGQSVPENLRVTHKRCNRRRGPREHPIDPGPILNFVVDPDLVRRLDDYRFERRFPSRAAAVKALIRWALEQNPTPSPESTP